MIAIGILLFILLIGGMGLAVFFVLKKTDPKKVDTSLVTNITTAQEFLPFEEIKDGMICLGLHKYRAIIECSSTNYNLKTDKEKEIIEISFQRFLNSLTFPIVFYIQTKIIDNSKMLESLKEELLETIKTYPQLEEYADAFFVKMANLNANIGNNIQKKKYIIVPFEEAINLANLSDEEKYSYSSKELYNRASMIVDGLSAVGVKGKILNTEELYELVYSTYHKDNYLQFENIASGEFLSIITEAKDARIHSITDDAKLDWILYEAQMRINNEMLNENVPDFIRANCEKTIRDLDNLRDNIGAYYKENVEEIRDIDDKAFKKLFGNTNLDNKKGGGN